MHLGKLQSLVVKKVINPPNFKKHHKHFDPQCNDIRSLTHIIWIRSSYLKISNLIR